MLLSLDYLAQFLKGNLFDETLTEPNSVVAVHGTLGWWIRGRGLVEYMAQRKISCDFTGFGWQTDRLSSYCQKLKSKITPGITTLVGISSGGLIALDYLRHYPESLQHVILIGTPLAGVKHIPPLLRIHEDLCPNSDYLTQLLNSAFPQNKITGIFAQKDEFVGNPNHLPAIGTKIIVGATSHGDLLNHARWLTPALDTVFAKT